MKTISVDEFHNLLREQQVPREHLSFVCPMCGTVQSVADLVAAGAGLDLDAVGRFEGFSCVGRFTGAGSPRRIPDGQPCNWTLGGLLKVHEMEVVDEDGRHHPTFVPASRDAAQENMEKHRLGVE